MGELFLPYLLISLQPYYFAIAQLRMHITRLELHNFRCMSDLILENLPDTIALVSANGLGKSTILEAIIGAHDLVIPYHQDQYPFRENWKGYAGVPAWPSHLRKPVRFGQAQASLSIQIGPNDSERAFLKKIGIDEEIGKAEFVIEDGRYIKEASVNEAIRKES
jgi:AAA15 family ATPase/GTPase